MAAIHITVGTVEDLDLLMGWIEEHDSIGWPVPKNAKPGDAVLFLIPAFIGSIVASGKVASLTSPSETWAPKYESEISSIHRRANPIPIEVLQQRLPEWKYLTYARSYTTVPANCVARLNEILAMRRRFDLEAGISPDEVDEYWEGSAHLVTVNAYERDPRARQTCIDHFGARCTVCGFDFGSTYGPVGEGLIHVHHLRQLSDIASEYEVDPIADLRPVCPNCHAVIHRRNPPYSIQDVKKFLKSKRAN
jgi:hypothetical protein